MVKRHDAVKHALAEWIDKISPSPVRKEQEIPEWNTERYGRAVLDIVMFDNTGQRKCIDVRVADGAETAGSTKFALSRAEKEKHRRYPSATMIPFVLDCRGKWGAEALGLVKSVTQHLGAQENQRSQSHPGHHRLRHTATSRRANPHGSHPDESCQAGSSEYKHVGERNPDTASRERKPDPC